MRCKALPSACLKVQCLRSWTRRCILVSRRPLRSFTQPQMDYRQHRRHGTNLQALATVSRLSRPSAVPDLQAQSERQLLVHVLLCLRGTQHPAQAHRVWQDTAQRPGPEWPRWRHSHYDNWQEPGGEGCVADARRGQRGLCGMGRPLRSSQSARRRNSQAC